MAFCLHHDRVRFDAELTSSFRITKAPDTHSRFDRLPCFGVDCLRLLRLLAGFLAGEHDQSLSCANSPVPTRASLKPSLLQAQGSEEFGTALWHCDDLGRLSPFGGKFLIEEIELNYLLDSILENGHKVTRREGFEFVSISDSLFSTKVGRS